MLKKPMMIRPVTDPELLMLEVIPKRSRSVGQADQKQLAFPSPNW